MIHPMSSWQLALILLILIGVPLLIIGVIVVLVLGFVAKQFEKIGEPSPEEQTGSSVSRAG